MEESVSGNKLIRNKNFLMVTFGNVTSKFGTKIYEIVLAWWLVEQTGNAALFGYIAAASMLPTILCNVFSGALVDRLNKKYILVFTDFISTIVCFTIGLMMFNDVLNVPLLITAAILLGFSNSLFNPALKAIIPEIIQRDSLTKANSIINTLGQVITVVSPIIVGLLINNISLGLGLAFIINGMTFLISAISESLITYDKKINNGDVSFFVDVKIGFKYVKENVWLLRLLFVSAIVNFFIASYNIVLPMFFQQVYRDEGSLFSYALSSQALFGILAGIIIAKQKKDCSTLVNIKKELLYCGICLALMQLFTISYVSIIFAGLFGFFLTRFNIYFFTVVQKSVDKEKLGRVFSIIFMVALSVMPFGNFFFGIMSKYILDYVYIFSGLGIVLSTFIVRRKDY